MAVHVGHAALLHLDAPHDAGVIRRALRAHGASEIEEWEEGALEVVETWDAAGRRVVLLGGAPSQTALAIAERVAVAVGRSMPALIATTRAEVVRSRLRMDTSLRAFEVGPGARRELPAPALDDETLAYEDAEARPFPLDPADVAISAAQLASDALHAAGRALQLQQDAETQSARSHHRLAAPRLAPRVQALADAVSGGAVHAEERGADGRWRVEVQDAAGKRISFLSDAEREALHAALRAEP